MTSGPREGRGLEVPLHTVEVRAGGGERDYPVLVGIGVLAQLPELLRGETAIHRWAVISDENVARLHAADLMAGLASADLAASLFTFPPGEASKTRETWSRLTDELLREGYGRDSGVVAFGGGVTGDLAGFVAATLLRGVPVVQVPTSMVAMIDASVGGKTGVDTRAGKNLVGAFHPPRFVLADPGLLSTLPRGERAQGLVEALKHGLILDRDYFSRVETAIPALLDGHAEASRVAVLGSVRLKAEVVGRDEREAGYRQVLNFGHTLGHALEAASGFRLPHGSAVALGMILEARLGERLGITEDGVSVMIERAVRALGVEGTPAPDTDLERVSAFLGTDKKKREGRVRFVLLRRAGEVESEGGWSHPVPEDLVEAVLTGSSPEGVRAVD